MRHLLLFASALFLFLFSSGLQAQTHAWSSPSNGNWDDPLNWNTGSVPNSAGAYPTINVSGLTPYTVTMNINTLMDRFDFIANDAEIVINGRTVTMNGAGQLGPATGDVFTITNSSWLGTGTLRNQTEVAARGSVTLEHLLQDGTYRLLGSATGGNGLTTLNNTTNNNGDFFLLSEGAGFASTLTMGASQIFLNAGTLEFQVGAGGNRTFNGWLRNTGQVSIAQPTIFNTGPIEQQSGTFTVQGGESVNLNSGTDFFHNGGVLQVDGTFDQNSSNFEMLGGSINGFVSLRNGTLSILDPSLGTFKMRGTNTFLGSISGVQEVQVIGSPSNGNAVLNITNPLSNTGNLKMLSEGAGFASTITMGAGSALTNAATFEIQVGASGSRTFNGEFMNAASGTLQISQSSTFNTGPFENLGSWTVAPSTHLILGSNSTFTQSAGTFDLQGTWLHASGTDQFNGGTFTGTPELRGTTLGFGPGFSSTFTPDITGSSNLQSDINAGTTLSLLGSSVAGNGSFTSASHRTSNGNINFSSVGAGFASTWAGNGAVLTNQGTLRTLVGAGGARTIQGGFENFGTVEFFTTTIHNGGTVRNSATWTMDPGGNMSMPSGQVFEQLAGTFDVGGGFLHLNGSNAFNGGTLLGVPELRNSALSFDPLGFTNPATILLTGSTTLNSDVPAATQLNLHGSSVAGNQLLTVPASATFAGTTEMSSFGAGFASTLTTAAGQTLTNSGTLRTEIGAGGGRTINGNLTNTGSVEIGTSTVHNSGILRNQGTLGVGAGSTFTMNASSHLEQLSGGIVNLGSFIHNGGTNLFVSGKMKGVVDLRNATTSFDPAFVQPINLRMLGSHTFLGTTVQGQTISIEGNSSLGNAVFTTNAGFTNGGDINLTSVGAGFAATLTVNNGPFNNTGSLDVLLGVGGGRTINGPVQNSGIISVNETTANFNTGHLTNLSDGVIRGDGTYKVNGGFSLMNQGAIRPGNNGIGSLNITGPYSQSATGFLVAELGGLVPIVEHDVLVISGNASLDGEVRVRAVNGFVPVFGQPFVILTAGSISGVFSGIRLVGSSLPLGHKFELTYTSNSVTAEVVGAFNNIDPVVTPVIVADPVPGLAGQSNAFQISGLGAFHNTQLAFGLGLGTTAIAGCPVDFGLLSATVIGTAVADADGNALVNGTVPPSAIGVTGYFQALDVEECQLSEVSTFLFP